MNFSEIKLNRKELKTLRQCENGSVPLAGNERFVRLRLAWEIVEHVPGRMGNRTGMLKLSDEGQEYLAYLDGIHAEQRQERRHEWLIALLSTFGGALLSKPVWAALGALWDWLTSLG